LREALKTIPQSQAVAGGGQWRTLSRAVTDAKQRYEQVRGLPGTDADGALRELLHRIDDLSQAHAEETIHQKRLIAVMVERTGAEPLASGTKPVDDYQDLLTRLDEAVHNEITLQAVTLLWAQALAILRQLFLPPDERHQELSKLAKTTNPAPADVTALKSLLAAPSHLEYFLARIDDPSWLILLDAAEILGPPGRQGAWPVFAAVQRLKARHASQLSALLTSMFDRWGTNPERAFSIARAALELGTDGQSLVLKSARQHAVHSAFGWLALQAAQKADPADEYVQQVADCVISSVLQSGANVYLRPLLDAYVAGVTTANYAERIRILCYKLIKVPEHDHYRQNLKYFRGGSIASRSPARTLTRAPTPGTPRSSERRAGVRRLSVRLDDRRVAPDRQTPVPPRAGRDMGPSRRPSTRFRCRAERRR